MSSIELSAGLMAGLPARVLRQGDGSAIWNTVEAGLLCYGNGGFSTYAGSFFYIGKGAVPTQASITDNNTRSSDYIVRFANASESGWGDAQHFAPTNQNVNPALISSIYSNAHGSGLATWFMWVTRPHTGGGGGSFSAGHLHRIIGTVGGPGSGADLEISNPNIVSGQPYRIQSLKLEFPSIWTF